MSKFNFNPQSIVFDMSNAYYLANLADLAYADLDKITDMLKADFGLLKYKSFANTGTDTQAFIAANDDIMVLVFRGTNSWEDWMTNFDVPKVPSAVGFVHLGFKKALDSVWVDIYDAVMSWKAPKQTLWVTGHSLGGALATLAVDRLTEENVELVSGLYTFGQPRVGNKQFADNFDRKMQRVTFRIVDDEDIVTKVPLPGYYHIGHEYYIDNVGKISHVNTFWKWFVSVSKSVAIRSGEDARLYRSRYPGGISDHSMRFYIKYLAQNLPKTEKNTFLDYINKKK